jgi:hypothetical protein
MTRAEYGRVLLTDALLLTQLEKGTSMTLSRIAVVASVCAVVVLGAISTAPAYAAPCKALKERWVVCGPENEVLPEAQIEGVSSESVIKTAAMTISCAKGLLSTTYHLGIPFTSNLTTASCTVVTPVGCVAESYEGALSASLVGSLSGAPEVQESGAGEGEKIASIEISGCGLRGVRVLRGKQTCKFDSKIQLPQEAHEVICSGASSKIEFGEEAAEFVRTMVDRLSTKAHWSVQLN